MAKMIVYLCIQNDTNYCGAVFDSIYAARLFCERHKQFHFIKREVDSIVNFEESYQ
jgi:hypothetical protein